MKKDAKLIFSPQLANFLLSRGFKIIKLKPRRGAENETVFVFKLEDYLLETIEEWIRQVSRIMNSASSAVLLQAS